MAANLIIFSWSWFLQNIWSLALRDAMAVQVWLLQIAWSHKSEKESTYTEYYVFKSIFKSIKQAQASDDRKAILRLGIFF